MSVWSNVSFNLAVLMNLLVCFFYPLEGVHGGQSHIIKHCENSLFKTEPCPSTNITSGFHSVFPFPSATLKIILHISLQSCHSFMYMNFLFTVYIVNDFMHACFVFMQHHRWIFTAYYWGQAKVMHSVMMKNRKDRGWHIFCYKPILHCTIHTDILHFNTFCHSQLEV